MATIVAAAGGGNFTVGSTWVGGVAPTAADDAQIDSTSGNVTIDSGAVCRSCDCNTYTGVLTHNAITLNIGDGTAGAGNIALRLVAGMTYTKVNSATSAIAFISTSATQQTITLGTQVLGNTTFNATSNGSWLFSDAFSCGTAALTLTKGTLNTNGQTVTTGLVSGANSNVRTLTLGATAWTASANWSFSTTTNMTFNANTSTITLTSGGGTFSGGGLTYNNVVISGAGTYAISQANTFANFTRTGTAVKTDSIEFGANQTITGTLTFTGNSVTNRLRVRSDTIGTARTITNVGATMTWSNVDVRDITLGTAFDASAITGLSGDCGGNTNITFTTAATQTATGTASFSWSTHGWTSRVPLPQDNVVINNAFAASQTVTLDMPRAGKSIDWTGATGTPAWAKTTATSIFGSITMISGMTNSGSSSITLEGRGAFTFTSAGQTFSNNLIVAMVGGTLTMQDAFVSTSVVQHDNGTLSFNDFSSTFTRFDGNNSLVRTLTLGSATMSLNVATAISVFSVGSGTNLTLTATTGTIKFIDTGNNAQTFAGGGKTYGNLWFSRGASTGSLTITGSNTFTDFKDNGTAAHSLLFTAGITTTVTTFTVSGTAGNLITINSTTTATHALTKAGGGTISSDYLNIQHSVASPANTWYAGENSTDNQAVATAGSGWTFTLPPEVLFGKWMSSLPSIIPRTQRVIGNDGSSLNPMQIGGAVEDVTSDKWGPRYPEFIWKAARSADFPQVQALYPGTRLYFPSSAATVAISPTPDAAWEDTTLFVRSTTSTVKSGTSLTTVLLGDTDETDRDLLLRQYVSPQLVAGQIITGSQTIKAQVKCRELNAAANVFLTIGIRVIASNGTTVRKTVLPVTRDDVEFDTSLGRPNRQFTATSAATNYTTVAGDRLVIELGAGGDPAAASDHDFQLVLGDQITTDDLPEDDTTTTTLNPWVQLSDQLVFAEADPLFITRLPAYSGTAWALIKLRLAEYQAFFQPAFDPVSVVPLSAAALYPDRIWPLPRSADLPSFFQPAPKDLSIIAMDWLSNVPEFIWKAARSADFPSFFHSVPKDVAIIAMDWLSKFPDKIDRLPPLPIPGEMAPMWQPEIILSSMWQNYLPDYVWRNRLKTSNAWWHPAMMAQLFTGSDFLHAEWYSSPSLSGRWDSSPSLLAEFESAASMGDNQGTNP